MRLDRHSSRGPGDVSLDQLRVNRVGQVEELVVERKGRVVPSRTRVQEPAATKAQLDEQLLLRPDAQLSRRHSNRLPGGIRGRDVDWDLSHDRRIRRVGDVDDQYPRVDVSAGPVGVSRGQDWRYRTAAVQISARVRPIRPIPDIDIVVEHRDRRVLAAVKQGVVADKLDIERGARTAYTNAVGLLCLPAGGRSEQEQRGEARRDRAQGSSTEYTTTHQNPPSSIDRSRKPT